MNKRNEVLFSHVKRCIDLLKVSKNYNHNLPKAGKRTVTGNFNLPKVRKIIKVTCPTLVKVTNLLDF